jgi:hypothetical protein
MYGDVKLKMYIDVWCDVGVMWCDSVCYIMCHVYIIAQNMCLVCDITMCMCAATCS